MKTLNYIDPIVSPAILLDRPGLHTNFESQWNNKKQDHSQNFSVDNRFVVKYANGSKITDTRGNEYIDFNLSQGANILGHTPSYVLNAIDEALKNGISHGMPTQAENLLAKSIREALPSVEKIKLLNSGAEAVKGAIRLARAFTGKKRIVVIEGTNANIANNKANDSSILPFNNINVVAETFSKYGNEIAAIFVEPIVTNRGVVLPNLEYLQFLRNITSENQSLLIFDETTTGFRSKLSGAQGYFNVIPDLTVLGKIVGAGFPIGAVGGKKEIIALPDIESNDIPLNSITAIAGIAALKRISSPLFYETLNHRSRDFIYCLTEITKHKGIKVNSYRSMFSIQLPEDRNYELFHKKLMEKGVYLSPTSHEPNYISIAHLPEDLNRTLEVVYNAVFNPTST